ncbi:MAG: HlyD family type I secretion periplasmic adaptor subunit [Hydrogenophaga sp.]|uniref:HlyD family type I secretion periplasmic adaptor subunit n=1 Tax=Hydrogenophaga sp. TaxID=1904254 RepID=UPI00257E0629|nr:HlyD family type I secretion periplasmic adaptor subunit [Hydrogenophaga sp.]MBL0943555.1 HlyD family type I secretion periplasmic adaptor subunit [Hydrogenophaga sp.]
MQTTARPDTSLPARHPAWALLQRYRQVLGLAWRHRDELAGPARLRDEAAFLPAALSLQETPVHPAPLRLAWALMALFLIALTWALVGKVDIVAVAPGRIVVSERTKLIQPLEPSVVRRVLVKDGDRVAAGQLLVELDPTAASADQESVGEQTAEARREMLRAGVLLQALRAHETSSPPVRAPQPAATDLATLKPAERQALLQQIEAEWVDLRARFTRLDAETQRSRAELRVAREAVARLEATLPLVRSREADYQALVKQGFMSSHATQDRQRERIDMERELATLNAREIEVQWKVTESQATRQASWAEAQRDLRDRESKARTLLARLEQEATKAKQRQDLTQLRSPVVGTVQQLAVHTPGGVVTEAQPLMVIVPDGASVVAEVTLENKDIGFVSPGQAAEIKLETFLYTRYGTVPATVQFVSMDAVQDEKKGAIYLATLQMAEASMDIDGRVTQLAAGMNLTAEIRTGQRRVIEYLLRPIQQVSRESIRER